MQVQQNLFLNPNFLKIEKRKVYISMKTCESDERRVLHLFEQKKTNKKCVFLSRTKNLFPHATWTLDENQLVEIHFAGSHDDDDDEH